MKLKTATCNLHIGRSACEGVWDQASWTHHYRLFSVYWYY